MIKEVVKPKEGYEKVVEVFDELIANIEEAKAEEIAAIEQKYADRLDKYNGDRANYVEVELVEVPDEEVVTSEEYGEIGVEYSTATDDLTSV